MAFFRFNAFHLQFVATCFRGNFGSNFVPAFQSCEQMEWQNAM